MRNVDPRGLQVSAIRNVVQVFYIVDTPGELRRTFSYDYGLRISMLEAGNRLKRSYHRNPVHTWQPVLVRNLGGWLLLPMPSKAHRLTSTSHARALECLEVRMENDGKYKGGRKYD